MSKRMEMQIEELEELEEVEEPYFDESSVQQKDILKETSDHMEKCEDV